MKYIFLFFLFLKFEVYGQNVIARPFIDSAKNNIKNIENDTNWSKFVQKIDDLKAGKTSKVSIVHLGDSHIQGGVLTNRVRQLLNIQYGVSGRGLVFPYSLINTNGPDDVKYFCSSKFTGQKYSLITKDDKTSISGYNFWVNDTVIDFALTLKKGSDTLFPFNGIVMYHNSPALKVSCRKSQRITHSIIGNNLCATKIIFDALYDSVELHIEVPQSTKSRLAFYGIELTNNKPGILYHSVGSNGITYEAFMKSINYLPILKQLQPDCIIISLGTNDSYKRPVDTLVLKKRIVTIIDELKKELPGTCIMLTTPGDHLLEKAEPNPNLIKTHDAVLKAAVEEKCVYWDFFEVMGGLYSSKRWDREGLMYKDILHFNKEGYKLQGDLFYSALVKALKN